MRKTSMLLFLIITMANYLPGQTDVIGNEQDLHRLVQLKNTSKILKNYFEDKKIVSESDFFIAIILPPMGCPRCEGLISPFLKDIKKIDSTLNTAVFTFYSKSKPAYNYLLERRFPADDFYIFTSNKVTSGFAENGIYL